MNILWTRQKLLIGIVLGIPLAGCDNPPNVSPTKDTNSGPSASVAVIDLDAELARAAKQDRGLTIFVFDPMQNDSETKSLKVNFELSKPTAAKNGTIPLLLDLSASRNRATATRFHITDGNTPLLICISPKGMIVSRDERPTAFERRYTELGLLGPQLDAKLAELEEAIKKNHGDPSAQMALADFLVKQYNVREAVPHLESVAHSEAVDLTHRVQAWVKLGWAHLWVAEPEKGRHEASDLIAALGTKTPDALAGGNLILGSQDVNAKRFALARKEFEAAITASPQSTYAKEAAAALGALPKAN